MKLFVYIFTIGCVSITSCSDKRKDHQRIEARTGLPAIPPADLAALGLENLNISHKMKDILCQCWSYTEDIADAKEAGNDQSSDPVYRGYCFFSDGTVLKNPRGYFQTGKWNINEHSKPVNITLTLDDGVIENYRLAFLMPYQMKLVPANGNEKKLINLSSGALRCIHLTDDPFYISNMSWRIKPSHPETDEAIKQRLKSCIHFFSLFYQLMINAHAEVVTFTGLPSCFTWYAGGIYLQKEDVLQQKWIDCFYNKKQAMQAYKLADRLLGQKYTWPEGEKEWLKQNVAVIRQMEIKIDLIN